MKRELAYREEMVQQLQMVRLIMVQSVLYAFKWHIKHTKRNIINYLPTRHHYTVWTGHAHVLKLKQKYKMTLLLLLICPSKDRTNHLVCLSWVSSSSAAVVWAFPSTSITRAAGKTGWQTVFVFAFWHTRQRQKKPTRRRTLKAHERVRAHTDVHTDA